MLEKLVSGVKKAAVVIATAGVLATGCYMEPIRTHFHSNGWRSDAEPGPEQVVRVVPGVYNDDYYMTCHGDSRGTTVCYCNNGQYNQAGEPIKEPCESVEQTKKERSPRHVICYKKNPRDCHQH